MKLLELYSLSTGLKINKPFIYKAFFPVPFEKYITLHASSGMQSKNYSFWEDVIELIKPTLDKLGISIIQIGGQEDEKLKYCYHLQGKLNIHQTSYILSNTTLHVGNDSFSAHVAGAFNKPLVTIYGATTIENHSPYFFNKEETVFIEVDRKGKKPSFASEEFPKMIDNIKPEDIAKAIIKSSVKRESLYFGEYYPSHIIEYIPDYIIPSNYLAAGIINVRMDYHFDEDNLVKAIYNRKCNIVSNKPINLKIIKTFKKHINRFSLEVSDNITSQYVKDLKSTGVDVYLLTKETDKNKIDNLRLKHFDFEINQDEIRTKENLDFGEKICENTFFRTNKFILAKDGIFLSIPDWKQKRPIKNFDDNIRQITDSPDFWEDVEYFYIFNQ